MRPPGPHLQQTWAPPPEPDLVCRPLAPQAVLSHLADPDLPLVCPRVGPNLQLEEP
jgi:hypothetical protein